MGWPMSLGGRNRPQAQAFPQRVLQLVDPVVAADATGHEADRVAASRTRAPVASAEAAHTVAVIADPEAKPPGVAGAEHPVRPGALRSDRLREHSGAEQGTRG